MLLAKWEAINSFKVYCLSHVTRFPLVIRANFTSQEYVKYRGFRGTNWLISVSLKTELVAEKTLKHEKMTQETYKSSIVSS